MDTNYIDGPPLEVPANRAMAQAIASAAITAGVPVSILPRYNGGCFVTVPRANRDDLLEWLGCKRCAGLTVDLWSTVTDKKVSFDADLWFQIATREQILNLARCGFRTNDSFKAADGLALWAGKLYPEVAEILHIAAEAGPKEKGFGLLIHADAALEWISHYRDFGNEAAEAYKEYCAELAKGGD